MPVAYTAFQRHAMRVACHTCGAVVGQPCIPREGLVIPADACRVHVTRSIAADYATPSDVSDVR